MEERYLRRENESDIEYTMRLISILKEEKPEDLGWEDIKELTGFEGHRDSLRKANDTPYGGYNIHKYYKDLIHNGIQEDNLLKELNIKKIELQKEKQKIKDANSESRRIIRSQARFDNLKEEMIEAINNINKDKILKNTYSKTTDNNKIATLILSDWHCGMYIENYWNTYDTNILKERVQHLQDKTIEYCELHKVDTLNVELLGDLVQGIIHVSGKVYSSEQIIKQIQIVSELLSELLCNLSNHIAHINVYNSVGNHGRIEVNYKEEIDENNFEYLIEWYLKSRLSNIKNIKFCKNKYDNEIVVYKVFNQTIFAIHGNRDRINKVIKDLSTALRIIPDEIHMGHFHHHEEKEDNNVTIIVNGSLSGVDQHSKKKRFFNKPHQKLIIYNEDGQECEYKIKFKEK